jgi:predicted DNA-binding transcriptional regulator AlpA
MANLEWKVLEVQIPAKKLLSKKEVCLYLEIGRDALNQLIADGRFPRPIILGGRTKRWRAEWVRWYLDTQELMPRLVAGEYTDGIARVAPESPGTAPIRADEGGNPPKRRGGGGSPLKTPEPGLP